MLLSRRGQHTGEYAVLFGMAALVAISMQGVARRLTGGGIHLVTDVTLNPATVQQFAKADTGESHPDSTVTERGNGGAVTTVVNDRGGGSSSQQLIQTWAVPEPPHPHYLAAVYYRGPKGQLYRDSNADGILDAEVIYLRTGNPLEGTGVKVASIDPTDPNSPLLPGGGKAVTMLFDIYPPPRPRKPSADQGEFSLGETTKTGRYILETETEYVDAATGDVIGKLVYGPIGEGDAEEQQLSELKGIDGNGDGKADADKRLIFSEDGAPIAVEQSGTIRFIRPRWLTVAPEDKERVEGMMKEMAKVDEAGNSPVLIPLKLACGETCFGDPSEASDSNKMKLVREALSRDGREVRTEEPSYSLPLIPLDIHPGTAETSYQANAWAVDTDGDFKVDHVIPDLNGNHKPDEIALYAGDSPLTLQEADSFARREGTNWDSAKTADVDGDKKIDVVNNQPVREVAIRPRDPASRDDYNGMWWSVAELKADGKRYEPVMMFIEQAPEGASAQRIGGGNPPTTPIDQPPINPPNNPPPEGLTR